MGKIVVRSKIWLEVGDCSLIGEGREQLLMLIDEHSSISAAAREMGLSYRKAWSNIQAMEQALDFRLIDKQRGGSGGGASELTQDARDLLHFLNGIRKKFKAISEELAEIEFR
jgi:molybdate transport system regulatory protein